jgi:hypothetical protein
MKKALLFVILAVFTANIIKAQEADEFRENWQQTITVPDSNASTIEKLFEAWGKVFPGKYVDAFHKFKETGNADKIEFLWGFENDFKVELAPKNGFLEIDGTFVLHLPEDNQGQMSGDVTKTHILTAVIWNLQNGNKLFAVSINDDGEVFAECAIAFYEYDAKKGTLTPRIQTTQKVLDIIKDTETFVRLPKEGRDLHYIDYGDYGKQKTIKWNGNGF